MSPFFEDREVVSTRIIPSSKEAEPFLCARHHLRAYLFLRSTENKRSRAMMDHVLGCPADVMGTVVVSIPCCAAVGTGDIAAGDIETEVQGQHVHIHISIKLHRINRSSRGPILCQGGPRAKHSHVVYQIVTAVLSSLESYETVLLA